eukprot:TRINITY_DN7374_c0_g1_i4.p1 TRINITY_DN7374_c0_g1~~TRINITY_DN7374_c0_g1_i4.p1  ORF type:complete len:620 (-),score=104.81 TRINITY_DN7374_c0_g1_i4:3114-4973(-)
MIYGIELDKPLRQRPRLANQGRNNGMVNETRYFACDDDRGIFVQEGNFSVLSGKQSERIAERDALAACAEPDRSLPYSFILPDDMVVHVLGWLRGEEVTALRRVCRTWNQLIDDDSLWRCVVTTTSRISKRTLSPSLFSEPGQALAHFRTRKRWQQVENTLQLYAESDSTRTSHYKPYRSLRATVYGPTTCIQWINNVPGSSYSSYGGYDYDTQPVAYQLLNIRTGTVSDEVQSGTCFVVNGWKISIDAGRICAKGPSGEFSAAVSGAISEREVLTGCHSDGTEYCVWPLYVGNMWRLYNVHQCCEQQEFVPFLEASSDEFSLVTASDRVVVYTDIQGQMTFIRLPHLPQESAYVTPACSAAAVIDRCAYLHREHSITAVELSESGELVHTNSAEHIDGNELRAAPHELYATRGPMLTVYNRHTMAYICKVLIPAEFLWCDGRHLVLWTEHDADRILGTTVDRAFWKDDALLIHEDGHVQTDRISVATVLKYLYDVEGDDVLITSRTLCSTAAQRLLVYFAYKPEVTTRSPLLKQLQDQGLKLYRSETKRGGLPRAISIGAELPCPRLLNRDVTGQVGLLVLLLQEFEDDHWQSAPLSVERVVQMLGQDAVKGWKLSRD